MIQRANLPATHWRTTPIARVLRPMQEFIDGSTSGGLVLLGAAVLALALANSPLAGIYAAVLHSEVTLAAGPFRLSDTLLHWINDGLMAIFFFQVGLEMKREVLVGELADRRAAVLPVAAAIGGALAPATIYVLINWGRSGVAGWGVPMATDIAFALGVLLLLGDRIPFALKVFLTGVAIADDLLAVLVIAIFYSSGLDPAMLIVAVAILALLGLLNLFGIRSLLVYSLLGVAVWLAMEQSGIHATIAGVLVALTVPARRRIDAQTFLAQARALLAGFPAQPNPAPMLIDEQQQCVVLELEDTCEGVLAPLQKAEHTLHRWVAFLILPVFALANAGVGLSLAGVAGDGWSVVLGITAGLLIGKPAGLVLAAWLVVRAGIAVLPPGVSWRHMVGVGWLAGIGFTMSIFIAALGFGEGVLLDAAKLAILGASVVAGVLGYVLLRRFT